MTYKPALRYQGEVDRDFPEFPTPGEATAHGVKAAMRRQREKRAPKVVQVWAEPKSESGVRIGPITLVESEKKEQ